MRKYQSLPTFDLDLLGLPIKEALFNFVEMAIDYTDWLFEHPRPHWKTVVKKYHNHARRIIEYSKMIQEFIDLAKEHFKQKRTRAYIILFRDLQLVKFARKERGTIVYNKETDESIFGKDKIKRVYHYYLSITFRKVRVATSYGTKKTAFIAAIGLISTYGRKINKEYPPLIVEQTLKKLGVDLSPMIPATP